MILDDDWADNEQLELFTDASCSIGFAAFFQGKWTYGVWPVDSRLDNDITFKELFPIVVALHLWGDYFKNKKILFRCDNEAVVTIINKQSSRSRAVMSLLRPLVLFCLSHNIMFRAKHISGVHNEIADALSRCQFTRFRALAPEADRVATPIPQALWARLLKR